MENATFGFVGALFGAGLGFIGSVLGSYWKSRDTSKEILTRTITNERAIWRTEMRQRCSEFAETALRVANNDAGTTIYTLEGLRLQILLRVNPNPSHPLDSSILSSISSIREEARARNPEGVQQLLSAFESSVQTLIKQEWDKSKREAITGKLETDSITTTGQSCDRKN